MTMPLNSVLISHDNGLLNRGSLPQRLQNPSSSHRVLSLIAGVDEAGRGPLVGSVVAAAVILNPADVIVGLNDSKALSAQRREQLYIQICTRALAWSVCEATAAEIDALNILQATLLAMQRAVNALEIAPSSVLVDGNRCPALTMPCQAIIGGDLTEPAISAASILAKVTRDGQLVELDKRYPDYGFAQHKGYPTKAHIQALQQFGPIDQHRRSYKPVQISLEQLAKPEK